MSLLTSLELADKADCSISYIHILRRVGTITPAKTQKVQITGGKRFYEEYSYTPDTVETVKMLKASAVERQRTKKKTRLHLCNKRVECTKCLTREGKPRMCAMQGYQCEQCLAHFQSVPGAPGTSIGDCEFVGAAR